MTPAVSPNWEHANPMNAKQVKAVAFQSLAWCVLFAVVGGAIGFVLNYLQPPIVAHVISHQDSRSLSSVAAEMALEQAEGGALWGAALGLLFGAARRALQAVDRKLATARAVRVNDSGKV